MNPLSVLRMAAAMNGGMKKVLLVGCEPATFGGEEGHMGLERTGTGGGRRSGEMVSSAVEKLLREAAERSSNSF